MSVSDPTTVQLADIIDIAGPGHTVHVLAPDRRDPSGMATVTRSVESVDYTGDASTPDQWTIAFADTVPGNASRLITNATRRWTLAEPTPATLPPASWAYRRNPERPGETLPYVAGNGHLMVAPVADTGRVSESGAWCAPGCESCGSDQRPDW